MSSVPGGLWSQLGASDIVTSCGPELAQVLHQVDIMIEAKRKEWQEEFNRADARAQQAAKNEQLALIKMKEQQIEYENRIRQLRIDLGALKEAYLKLEKNHVGKPDKLKRVLLEKNRQINSFQQENEKLKNDQDSFEKEKERVGKQLEEEKKKLDEEKLRNIMLQRDVSKLSTVKVENEFLTLELEKLKLKYSNLKKTFHKKTLEHTVAEARNPPVPKLNLPTPNLPANESECDTPRSSSSVSNSVYVVPIPVFDIDDDGDAAKQSPSTTSTPRSNPTCLIGQKYEDEDRQLFEDLNSKIDAHIDNFQEFLSQMK